LENACGTKVDVMVDPVSGNSVYMWKPGWVLDTLSVDGALVRHSNGYSCMVSSTRVRPCARSWLPAWMVDSAVSDLAAELEHTGVEMQVCMVAGKARCWLFFRFLLLNAYVAALPCLLQLANVWDDSKPTSVQMKSVCVWLWHLFVLLLCTVASSRVLRFVTLPLIQHVAIPTCSPWFWTLAGFLKSSIGILSVQSGAVWIATSWKAICIPGQSPNSTEYFVAIIAIGIWLARLLSLCIVLCKIVPKPGVHVDTELVKRPNFYPSRLEENCSNEITYSYLIVATYMTSCTDLLLPYVLTRMLQQVHAGKFLPNPKAATERLFIRRFRLFTERAVHNLLFEQLIIAGSGLVCKIVCLAPQIEEPRSVDRNLVFAVLTAVVLMVLNVVKSVKHAEDSKHVEAFVRQALEAPITKEDERNGVEKELVSLGIARKRMEFFVRVQVLGLVLIFIALFFPLVGLLAHG